MKGIKTQFKKSQWAEKVNLYKDDHYMTRYDTFKQRKLAGMLLRPSPILIFSPTPWALALSHKVTWGSGGNSPLRNVTPIQERVKS